MQPNCIQKKKMPANLNALIRYRTIDQCLSNPYRKWNIDDLKEACSEALREHRGISSGISVRSIRDDIRVMRSDMLGFNAPIVQSGGYYYYEDGEYSIFNVTISDEALLSRILKVNNRKKKYAWKRNTSCRRPFSHIRRLPGHGCLR